MLDHAGEVLAWASAAQVAHLLEDSRNVRIGTARRIRAVRLSGPDVGKLLLSGSGPRQVVGVAHRRETWDNPAGCWTIGRIAPKLRSHFVAVLADVLVK